MFEFIADVLGEFWEARCSVFYRVKNGPVDLKISPAHMDLRGRSYLP